MLLIFFSFHRVAYSTPLSQSRQTLQQVTLRKHGKRVRIMERRQFSIRDKQISVLSWKLGVWLVCLPKKMDPHAELQMNQIECRHVCSQLKTDTVG